MNIPQQLQKKINMNTKPQGSLGKLETIALKIGTIQQTLSPQLRKPSILVFAADHGLSDEGVSPYPKEVTHQMVLNFLQGGAAINVFCEQHNISLTVVDAGVDFDFPSHANLIHAKIGKGTKNTLREPAMSVEECKAAFDKGKRIVKKEYEKGCNIIGFGEMGIGNTSSASLLMHKFTGIPLKDCIGRGTGLDNEGLSKKNKILEKVVLNYNPKEPLAILATYGGFEIAMMCGGLLEAAKKNMVILIDGFIATSALLAAQAISKEILKYCIFCHVSDEQGHRKMLDYLKADVILDLGMRLGEGTGAAVAFPIIQSAIAFLNNMASFEEAGVSERTE